MPQRKEVLAEEMDKLIRWIDVGRYAGCKKFIIPKIKPITVKEMMDATEERGSQRIHEKETRFTRFTDRRFTKYYV